MKYENIFEKTKTNGARVEYIKQECAERRTGEGVAKERGRGCSEDVCPAAGRSDDELWRLCQNLNWTTSPKRTGLVTVTRKTLIIVTDVTKYHYCHYFDYHYCYSVIIIFIIIITIIMNIIITIILLTYDHPHCCHRSLPLSLPVSLPPFSINTSASNPKSPRPSGDPRRVRRIKCSLTRFNLDSRH